MLIVTLAGCAPDNVTPDAEPEAEAPPPPLTEVHLPVLVAEAPFRWDEELRGLATLAIELGLADIPGTVPVLERGAGSPFVVADRPRPRRVVRAGFRVAGTPEALTYTLSLCLPGQAPCVDHVATAPREAPWPAFATLLDGAARTLGAEVPEATRTAWARPGSADTYAELVTGRACATYLGLLPLPVHLDDRRENPVLRAVHLDPAQPIAQWVSARWDVGTTTDGGDAPLALQRALLERPGSPLLAADLATVYAATGKPREALERLADLVRREPRDPRWLQPYAATLLAVGEPLEAQRVLDAVPADFAWDPGYARLRVEVAEARIADCLDRGRPNCETDLDPLLEYWQRADPSATEPVQRRLVARVEARSYASALPLVAALRARAPGPRTDALDAALQVAAGQLEGAAAVAPPEVAARLRARAAREVAPGTAVEGLPDADVPAALANADAALWRSEFPLALSLAERVLADDARNVDALVLRARALEGLGRTSAAEQAWRAAWEVDPATEGGPVGSGRIASTFRVVEE